MTAEHFPAFARYLEHEQPPYIINNEKVVWS